jgi:hypothetical protein
VDAPALDWVAVRPSTAIARVVLLCALASCAHGDAFESTVPAGTGPFGQGIVARLTLNPGVDRGAAWLPDESGFFYSADRLDRDDDDRCLVRLPPDGGQGTRTVCATSLASRDSLNTFDGAAITAAGRVAFVRTSSPPGGFGVRFNELALGRLDSIEAAATIRSIPFTIGTTFYSGVSNIRWLNGTALVYRAGFAGLACIDAAIPCTRAFIDSGIGIMFQDTGAAPQLLPGTNLANSVAVLPGGDRVVFTVMNDSRVFQLDLSTSAVSVFLDPGSGTARDVQVAGSRLAVIVGGTVQVINPAFNPPTTPPLQWDRGGDLFVADLATGATVRVTGVGGFRNPALSPSGTRVIVESLDDLWLVRLQ